MMTARAATTPSSSYLAILLEKSSLVRERGGGRWPTKPGKEEQGVYLWSSSSSAGRSAGGLSSSRGAAAAAGGRGGAAGRKSATAFSRNGARIASAGRRGDWKFSLASNSFWRHRLLGGLAAAAVSVVVSSQVDLPSESSCTSSSCPDDDEDANSSATKLDGASSSSSSSSSSPSCHQDVADSCSSPVSSDCSSSSSAGYVPPHNTFHPLWRSEQNQPFEKKMEDALIFCGNSNRPLAESVADCLGTKLGRVSVQRFADGEVSMQFLDSLRGKDVYIIQPTAPPVNENLMELLFMISTCRRSSARKITAVIPYYGYARQDRKLSSRVPISAADVARMIECMGVDRVVAVDLHCGQIQGFFGPRVPVDNLEAQLIGLEYFTEEQVLQNPVVVSPDAGGVYRARKFQKGLIARGHKDCGIAMLIKQRPRANEIERMDLVGTVTGSDVVIVDDMIDTAGTLCEAAKELKQRGAKRVFAFATHGLFSGPAIQRIHSSALEKVVVTDTLKCRELTTSAPRGGGDLEEVGKIKRISVAVLLADTIRRLHQKESLHDLFDVKAGN
eukprot:GHVS01032443.1.p1 GENE.GHVS01032443.1~~GHVS01032443.1.p1  ORF type:complete len:558 (+),score=129.65 GHVS01032443.1:240-1913(+)